MTSETLFNTCRTLLVHQFQSDAREMHINHWGWEKKEQVCMHFIHTLDNNLMNAFCSETEYFLLIYFNYFSV